MSTQPPHFWLIKNGCHNGNSRRRRHHSSLPDGGRQALSKAGPDVFVGWKRAFLLGNTRPTLDIDYFGHDINKDDLQQTIDQVAIEMQIDVDAVPLDEFIPIPNGASERHRLFARFGLLEVFLFDPYSISLSKIDRGFDTDIDDVVFLLRTGILDLQNLEMVVDEALTHAGDYDLIPSTTLTHLAAVRSRFGGG